MARASLLSGILVLAVFALGGCPSRPDDPPVALLPAVVDAGAPSGAGHLDAAATSIRAQIDAFARARGGLHAGPFPIAYRTFRAKDAPCFLFFVGADAALAAWVVTEGSFGEGMSTGEKRYRVPGAASTTTTEVGADVLFELVEAWPRAVRVTGVEALGGGNDTAVAIESLAARDQPSGLRGLVVVKEDSGSAMRADRVARGQWSLFDAATAAEALRRARIEPPAFDAADTQRALAFSSAASSSMTALAQSLGGEGVDVYEIWQQALVRRVEHVDATTLATSPRRDAILALVKKSSAANYCWRGACVVPGTHNEEQGTVVAKSGTGMKFASIALRPTTRPAPESPPTPLAGDDTAALHTLTFARGPVRSIARADVGGGRVVSVVADDRGVHLLEREGSLSIATMLRSSEGPIDVSARIVDLDGDGVSDVALFERFRVAPEPDAPAPPPHAAVILRSPSIDGEPIEDSLGLDVDMLGAGDVDDAIRRVRTRVPGVTPRVAEACALLKAASTPGGFRRNATPAARIAFFNVPRAPTALEKIVQGGDAAPFVPLLRDACSKSGDQALQCADGLCGILDYALGNFYRFVRVNGVLKLDLAMIYTGS